MRVRGKGVESLKAAIRYKRQAEKRTRAIRTATVKGSGELERVILDLRSHP